MQFSPCKHPNPNDVDNNKRRIKQHTKTGYHMRNINSIHTD